MSIRRGLMMGMAASGARFIKGTVTIPSVGDHYTINFGATFNEYLVYIEMDAASKTQLMNSGQTGYTQYAVLYKYATPVISGQPDSEYKLSYKVIPATAVFLSTSTAANVLQNITSTSIDLLVRGIGNTNAFYPGYTYNYYIVEIK